MLVDASVFFTANSILRTSIVPARCAASFVAVVATWLLNRKFTFTYDGDDRRHVEFTKYLIVSIISAATNLLVMLPVAKWDAPLFHVPSYGLGALAGLLVNFVLYDKFVFRRSAPSRKFQDTDGEI